MAKFIGASAMILKAPRSVENLSGWHSSNIGYFLCTQRHINRENAALYLSYYLNGLTTELLQDLNNPNLYTGPMAPVAEYILEALTTIIAERTNG